jgi:hypothetical protein
LYGWLGCRRGIVDVSRVVRWELSHVGHDGSIVCLRKRKGEHGCKGFGIETVGPLQSAQILPIALTPLNVDASWAD